MSYLRVFVREKDTKEERDLFDRKSVTKVVCSCSKSAYSLIIITGFILGVSTQSIFYNHQTFIASVLPRKETLDMYYEIS